MANPPRDLTPYASVRDFFGAELRRLRERVGLTQDQVGKLVNYSGAQIASVEKAVRWPTPELTTALDEALNSDGALTRLLPLVQAERARPPADDVEAPAAPVARYEGGTILVPVQLGFPGTGNENVNRRRFLQAAATMMASTDAPDLLAELQEVTGRMDWLSSSNVSEHTLGQLDIITAQYAAEYEESDAAKIYPAVLSQRRWVQDLLAGGQHPRERRHLFVLAGQLSALLGYLAFDAGHESPARLYCKEAFAFAETVGDRGLMAWTRGTESFIAYYQGHYVRALDLARDGQRHARGGPQSIRLAISGEARALGRLGDRAGVDDAVGRAFAARELLPVDEEVSAFLSFGPYSNPRIAGNAATAYLALGAVDKVREYTSLCLPLFDAHEVRASQALTRVDLAMALLRAANPEPEEAGSVMSHALAVGSGLRSEVVSRRADDFLAEAARYQSLSEIASVVNAVSGWRAVTP